jgi:hypothetical protein
MIVLWIVFIVELQLLLEDMAEPIYLDSLDCLLRWYLDLIIVCCAMITLSQKYVTLIRMAYMMILLYIGH